MAVDWRESSGTNHNHRLMALLKNGLGNPYDVTFLVGPKKQEVKGHQFILRLHSTVFEEQFKKEKAGDNPTITIEGGNKEEFEQFLQLLYTGEQPKPSQAAHLLKYAVQFKVLDLERWCWKTVDAMIEHSAVTVYELAAKHKNDVVWNKARTFILRNAASILDSSEILKLTYDNFLMLLTQDSLAATDETQVLSAVIRWGKEMCQRNGVEPTGTALRNVLRDLVRLIRYPVMSMSDFYKLVVPLEVLSAEELVFVIKYMNGKSKGKTSLRPPPFNTMERQWFKRVEPYLPSSSLIKIIEELSEELQNQSSVFPSQPQNVAKNSDATSVRIRTVQQPTAKRMRLS